MTCLKKEMQKLTKEIETHDETLRALKKHPKILKIQELDVKNFKKTNISLKFSLKSKQILRKSEDLKIFI